MERIIALGLVLGYLDVGVIGVGSEEFTFTVRGPLLWRLTSGIPPYLSKPSKGPVAQAYLRIEALLAYLLFVGEAYLLEASSGASTMVFTIGSKWLRFSAIQRLLEDDSVSFRHRTAILMLLNLAIGVGLIFRKFPFVLTAVGINRYLELRFYTSAAPLQRTRRLTPSLLTLPRMSAKLHWIEVIIGGMLVVQQAKVDSVLVERGGLVGFSIAADTFRLHVLPDIIQRLVQQAQEIQDKARK
ncbi:hypothetical protein LLE49_14630 [Alicyclobacillus tolerans]|uniref:hypothetical protein n=1 Tax=Alicyclobacillus tolerans TaxID=90970 RepID=UPI001F38EAC3|nr:hypothetical protein [Alicyclobacillus tolerans]MCF8565958.1 hypothetical protein [Alicyclobacillus tolerans]